MSLYGFGAADPGREIDWGRASADYAKFRPGPPPSLYEKLAVHGVGLPGQRILDLGTGTGVLAREFARRGAIACGVDPSAGQIEAARRLAGDLGVDFRVSSAEQTPFPGRSFDAVTANQCWIYFDLERAIAEVRRLLVPDGLLMISHFSWLPRLDPVARATENLILEFNPQWTAADFAGEVPPTYPWAEGRFDLCAMFWYDEPVAFTRETWRGRIRACRAIGAELPPGEVARFDAAHEKLLREIAPESFAVLHRIDAHLFRPR